MKKLIAILLSLSCLFACSACTASADKDDVQGESSWAEDWGITLTVTDVSSSGLTLTITQSGGIAEGRLETGAEYQLERTVDGKIWTAVTPMEEPVWDMMARIIHSDDSVEFELDWSWLYGQLEAGQYRICKTITLFGESGPGRSQFYSAEFTVK